MTQFLKQLIAEEEGATMVEYALMIALIGAALIGTVMTLSGNIGTAFTNTGSAVAKAAPASGS